MLRLFKKNKKEQVEVKESPAPILNMMLYLMSLEETYLKDQEGQLTLIPQDKVIIGEKENLERNLERLEKTGLRGSANYKVLEERCRKIRMQVSEIDYKNSQAQKLYQRKQDLIQYVKNIKIIFGEKATLVSYNAFDKICKDYNLKKGFLEDYSGVVPESNLKDIERFRSGLDSIPSKDPVYYINEGLDIKEVNIDRNVRGKIYLSIGIKDVEYWESIREDMVDNFKLFYRLSEVRSKYYSYDDKYQCERCSKFIDELLRDRILHSCKYVSFYDSKEDIKRLNRQVSIESLTIDSLKYYGVTEKEIRSIRQNFGKSRDYQYRVMLKPITSPLRVACLEEDLEVKKVQVFSEQVKDPIVYFESPYGVVVLTAWGEEAESEVLNHYMKINNIINVAGI